MKLIEVGMFIAAIMLLVVYGFLADKREHKAKPSPSPPCKLQMDKSKPNYNDCGAMIEPVAPIGDWPITTAEGKWIMQNGRIKVIPPSKDKK